MLQVKNLPALVAHGNQDIISEPSPLDAVSYNTLMDGYVRNTDVAKAIDVMNRMQRMLVTLCSLQLSAGPKYQVSEADE